MINLNERMGPGRDRTRDPWIYSQTPICCQTRYRLWLIYIVYRLSGTIPIGTIYNEPL